MTHRSAEADVNHETLVSYVIVCSEPAARHENAIAAAASYLERSFAFFEVIVIAPEADQSGEQLLAGMGELAPRTRFLRLEGVPSFDEAAALGYQECIGDIVVMTSADELDLVAPEDLVRPVVRGDRLVRVRTKRNSPWGALTSTLARAITGLEVDTRFYRSLSLNRQLLSEIMAAPQSLSLFRFTVHSVIGRQAIIDIDRPPARRGLALLLPRIELAARLAALSAPRLLRYAAFACGAAACAAFLSLLYVVGVWVFKSDVVEGWTSLTSLLGVWMMVQLGAMSLICLGLSRLIEPAVGRRTGQLVQELSSSDLFRNARLLNVDQSGAAPEGRG